MRTLSQIDLPRTLAVGCFIARNPVIRTFEDHFPETVCGLLRYLCERNTHTLSTPQRQLYVSSHMRVMRGTGSLAYVRSDLDDLISVCPVRMSTVEGKVPRPSREGVRA
jgi:hypothetical protein